MNKFICIIFIAYDFCPTSFTLIVSRSVHDVVNGIMSFFFMAE